jgi:hypothetical protein
MWNNTTSSAPGSTPGQAPDLFGHSGATFSNSPPRFEGAYRTTDSGLSRGDGLTLIRSQTHSGSTCLFVERPGHKREYLSALYKRREGLEFEDRESVRRYRIVPQGEAGAIVKYIGPPTRRAGK